MDCPHCAKLKKEFGSEGEREAKATLEQRSSCLCGRPIEADHLYRELQVVVHSSRKRQAELAEALNQHELVGHSSVA
jgi:hypothetical protein